ncbi:MAG: hypothetical protein OXF41_11015 [bacterium]|nr:hypothetical protein [bacterium]
MRKYLAVLAAAAVLMLGVMALAQEPPVLNSGRNGATTTGRTSTKLRD